MKMHSNVWRSASCCGDLILFAWPWHEAGAQRGITVPTHPHALVGSEWGWVTSHHLLYIGLGPMSRHSCRAWRHRHATINLLPRRARSLHEFFSKRRLWHPLCSRRRPSSSQIQHTTCERYTTLSCWTSVCFQLFWTESVFAQYRHGEYSNNSNIVLVSTGECTQQQMNHAACRSQAWQGYQHSSNATTAKNGSLSDAVGCVKHR